MFVCRLLALALVGQAVVAFPAKGNRPRPRHHDEQYATHAPHDAHGAPAAEYAKVVELQKGKVAGMRVKSKEGDYYAFKGIPYAQPPVGELRFMEPQPVKPWTDIKNETGWPQMCPQKSVDTIIGEEDCLYLNVFTPYDDDEMADKNFPVMVWIDGQSFDKGATYELMSPGLVANKVILVTIQYRVSILGFLSLGEPELPGNMGLKDQAMALQWVQDNIEFFGGDPDRVTLFGQNAGAVSIHFHMMSPMSVGLFHRVILQSPAPWDVMEVDFGKIAKGLREMCRSKISKEFLRCLQKTDLEKLIEFEDDVQERMEIGPMILPVVDGTFLPDHPARLLKDGLYQKMDMIIGTTEEEGALLARIFLEDVENVSDIELDNFERFGNLIEVKAPDADFVARRIFYHYKTLKMKPLERLIKMLGDASISMMTRLIALLHSRDEAYGFKVYCYELQHMAEHSYSELFLGRHPAWMKNRVTHMDDLLYLFPTRKRLTRDDDVFVSGLITKMWANFAAVGNPTPTMSLSFKWEPTSRKEEYLAIDVDPKMKSRNKKDFEFWQSLPTDVNLIAFPDHFE